MTSLITEGIKKTLTGKKPTIIAAVVSLVVGFFVPLGYIILNKLPFTAQDGVYIAAMVVLTWLCATLGYDKIWQVLNQLKG